MILLYYVVIRWEALLYIVFFETTLDLWYWFLGWIFGLLVSMIIWNSCAQIRVLLADKADLERELRDLGDKLSTAIAECNDKEELVVKHSKTAKEALAGFFTSIKFLHTFCINFFGFSYWWLSIKSWYRVGESGSKSIITEARTGWSFERARHQWREDKTYGCSTKGVYAAATFCSRR